ncbi:hypothetical protein D3C72_1959540 [compost metagenome]
MRLGLPPPPSAGVSEAIEPPPLGAPPPPKLAPGVAFRSRGWPASSKMRPARLKEPGTTSAMLSTLVMSPLPVAWSTLPSPM